MWSIFKPLFISYSSRTRVAAFEVELRRAAGDGQVMGFRRVYKNDCDMYIIQKRHIIEKDGVMVKKWRVYDIGMVSGVTLRGKKNEAKRLALHNTSLRVTTEWMVNKAKPERKYN